MLNETMDSAGYAERKQPAAPVPPTDSLKRLARYMWRGPEALPRELQLEWRFIAIRWLGILFVSPALAVAHLDPATQIIAFGVLFGAVVYNLSLQFVMVQHPRWFANGLLTAGCDAALNIGLIMVTGGFGTPLYFMLYTVTISAAMRYGYGPAFAMASLFVLFDLFQGLAWGRPVDSAFIFRSGFLMITALMAGYLQEQAHKAQAELRDRLRDSQALNEELESFSYSVSHDLRAPLRTIDGFSAIVMEDYGKDLDPEVHGYLQRMRAASQRMARLIDDLLDLSRLTRQEINYERVNLSGLAKEVLADLREREPERHVNASVHTALFALGDPDLLRVVLENLLANAWKFTRKTVEPRIEVGSFQREDRIVYFVRDNGAGFDPAHAQNMFRIFQRVHKDSEFEGTGIGLATVRRIIQRHGGEIWAEGSPQGGATFYFVLPARRHAELGRKEVQPPWLASQWELEPAGERQ